MRDMSFVRTEMLSEQPPPARSVGVAGWIRANLFSGPRDTVLTLVSLYVIYLLGSAVFDWALHDTWSATSLRECREIFATSSADGHQGACWGIIRERSMQMLFGFYPSEYYWRPILAFILLFVAIAPLLFPALPRQMRSFSPFYPFLAAFLLWGGSVWIPLVALAGFVIGYAALSVVSDRFGPLAGTIACVLAAMLWWLLLAGPAAAALQSLIPVGLPPVQSRAFGGFMLSITIGVVAIGASLPLGILLALGRQSDLLIVRGIAVGFIEFIRGVPLITLLFVASTLLNIFMPPGTNFDIILRVMIMVTLFASAYMAEVIRGGLAALPRGQYEAADSLGLDYWRAQRLIIMPQALKISIPGIVSTFIGVFKDTTLVSIIGLLDPLGLTKSILADQDWNGIVWELYGFIALLFFVFCFSMSRYSMHLERRLRTGNR